MHSIAGPVVLLWHKHSQLNMPWVLQQSISEATQTQHGTMMELTKLTEICTCNDPDGTLQLSTVFKDQIFNLKKYIFLAKGKNKTLTPYCVPPQKKP